MKYYFSNSYLFNAGVLVYTWSKRSFRALSRLVSGEEGGLSALTKGGGGESGTLFILAEST